MESEKRKVPHFFTEAEVNELIEQMKLRQQEQKDNELLKQAATLLLTTTEYKQKIIVMHYLGGKPQMVKLTAEWYEG